MRRRKFIGSISLGTAGIILGGLPGELYCMNGEGNGVFVSEALKTRFMNPPDTSKPHTWWHWREGRISKEGITVELEAMKRIGLGGVTMFSSSRMGETGANVLCLSPEWHDCVKHALNECDRLGLTFNFQNCAGWSGSGGPWITPDKNMMHVVFEKYTLDGVTTLDLEAPSSWPEKGNTFYRDIAVLAFPTPSAFSDLSKLPTPTVTSNFLDGDMGRLNLAVKNNIKSEEILPLAIEPGKSAWVQFEFPVAVTCRSVTITASPEIKLPDEHRAVVLTSEDGQNYKEHVRLSTFFSAFHRREPSIIHAIPQITARYFRLAWEGPAKLTLSRVLWSAEPVIYSQDSKIGELGRTFISEPVLPTEEGIAVSFSSILDLTDQLDVKRNLTWTAPLRGSWTVLRIGYQNNGKKNAPAAQEVTGLECDKFNPEAVAFHFDRYAGEIIRNATAVNSKNLTGITFDSWEAESQNWSPVFREEFRKRRGYDVLNYLPAFAGFIVGDRELTDRFLRDVRQTMSDLVSETFFGGMREIANKHGLKVHAEACGSGGAGTMVSDPVQHYLHVDIPMNEFGDPLKEASSAAHLTGKQVVAIEAFTQGRVDWQSCPSSLKAQGDGALCAGVNRFVFHTYVHNPDIDKTSPGPAFGPYGLAFSRGQTWWEMGRAWMDYLSRCQFLLQLGKPVSDILYFYGEEPGGPIPMILDNSLINTNEWAKMPKGFDYDLLSPEILTGDLSVDNGKLTLPIGVNYRLLVLRDSDRMTPEAAEKIKKLVKAGAIVLGPKPKHSPSLNNYPLCDKIVDKIGVEVWGNCDGKTITRNDYGKGHVFWGITLTEVLNTISLSPDFSVDGISSDKDLRFIHRQIDETDIYFISNNQSVPVAFNAKFRISGKKPEIWDPITGKINDSLSFKHQNAQTIISMTLESCGSAFVVFREPISIETSKKVKSDTPKLQQKLVLEGAWTVRFTSGWGAPESIEFARLDDWSKRDENGIKYYSGTAIYSCSFYWSEKQRYHYVFLDLGRVEVISEVKLNGKECGIAWTAPYQVEITDALILGENILEVRVANTWINRLLGDGLGIDTGAEKHTWTTINPFTTDPKFTIPEISKRLMPYYKNTISGPVASGLLGPVRVFISIDKLF